METKNTSNESSINKGLNNERKHDMVIVTDFQAWQYLFREEARKEKKYSKAEAFYFLLSNQRISFLTGEDDFMIYSIVKLMREWKWSRQNVNTFLDDLQKLKVIKLINLSKEVKIEILRTNFE